MRKQYGLTQADLADRVGTTARHVSFLETGRSRPRPGMVGRIANAFNISSVEKNSLLASAGLPVEEVKFDRKESNSQFIEKSIKSILRDHEPFPGCVVDVYSRIKYVNTPFSAFFSNLIRDSAEESIDAFFADPEVKNCLVNWQEIADAFYQRRLFESIRTGDHDLKSLSDQTRRYIDRREKPSAELQSSDDMVLFPILKAFGYETEFFMTVLRFESVKQGALSELRVELLYPKDAHAEKQYTKIMREKLNHIQQSG